MIVLDFIIRITLVSVVFYAIFIDKDFINDVKDLFK